MALGGAKAGGASYVDLTTAESAGNSANADAEPLVWRMEPEELFHWGVPFPDLRSDLCGLVRGIRRRF